MRVQLAGVARHHGSHVVLDGVDLKRRPAQPCRPRRPKRGRQVDAAPDPRRARASRRRHRHVGAHDADRRLPAAGAGCSPRRDAHRLPRPPHRRRRRRARPRRIRQGACDRPRRRRALRGRARPIPRARRRRPRASRGDRLRRARAAGRARPSDRCPVGRRSGAGVALPRSCSRASTCCSSTSRRTTSTSTGWTGSSGSSPAPRPLSSSCPTTARSSTARSTGSSRSIRAPDCAARVGGRLERLRRRPGRGAAQRLRPLRGRSGQAPRAHGAPLTRAARRHAAREVGSATRRAEPIVAGRTH